METTINFDIIKIKEDIKKMVELQKFYKNQRKTEKIIGERKISADEAAYKHKSNRGDLRVMYAVYGLAKGKCFSQIENHYPEDKHPLKDYQNSIDRKLEKYMIEVEVS
jgi:hypothetical protein